MVRERGEKEDRVGDEEMDVGQVVSAGGWGNAECMSSLFSLPECQSSLI